MTHGRAPGIAIAPPARPPARRSLTETGAIGAAAIALVVSLIGVIVVVTRSDATADRAEVQRLDRRVPAVELAKLRRDAIRVKNGVFTITDESLRRSLGLEASDVITHLAGRPLKEESDVTRAMAGASTLDFAIVYAEIRRGETPMLVRWEVDGSLQSARRGAALPDDPPKPSDPLLATIEKIGDHHYSVPRSTVERVLANPMDYAKGARFVPAIGSDGVKLYAIRTSSLWASLGFMNGDMIRAINGHPLGGVDGALEIYSKVRDAKELAIDITRRGKYELITVTIR